MLKKTGRFVKALPGPKIDLASKVKMNIAVRKDAVRVAKDAKNKEYDLYSRVNDATIVRDKAVAALKAIEAGNEVIRSKWQDVDTNAIDSTACTPVPECLQKQAVCTDTYDAANCIKARRGDINLCEKSARIQKECCATCT